LFSFSALQQQDSLDFAVIQVGKERIVRVSYELCSTGSRYESRKDSIFAAILDLLPDPNNQRRNATAITGFLKSEVPDFKNLDGYNGYVNARLFITDDEDTSWLRQFRSRSGEVLRTLALKSFCPLPLARFEDISKDIVKKNGLISLAAVLVAQSLATEEGTDGLQRLSSSALKTLNDFLLLLDPFASTGFSFKTVFETFDKECEKDYDMLTATIVGSSEQRAAKSTTVSLISTWRYFVNPLHNSNPRGIAKGVLVRTIMILLAILYADAPDQRKHTQCLYISLKIT
jgi:hypothetical protein